MATISFSGLQALNVMALDSCIDAYFPQDLLLGHLGVFAIAAALLVANGVYAHRKLGTVAVPESFSLLGKPRSLQFLAKAYAYLSIALFFLSAVPLWGTGSTP